MFSISPFRETDDRVKHPDTNYYFGATAPEISVAQNVASRIARPASTALPGRTRGPWPCRSGFGCGSDQWFHLAKDELARHPPAAATEPPESGFPWIHRLR